MDHSSFTPCLALATAIIPHVKLVPALQSLLLPEAPPAILVPVLRQLAAAMGAWAHDFAFLTLPLSGLLLSMLFMFNRRFVLFDHLVFSMHSLSFLGLLFVTAFGLQAAAGPIGLKVLWLSPIHLFAHMRGVYGTSTFGTLLRMAVLFTLSSIVFGLLMLGLVLVGLQTLKT